MDCNKCEGKDDCEIYQEWLDTRDCCCEYVEQEREKNKVDENLGKQIDEIKEEIKDWRKIVKMEETPKLLGEGFEKGWKLAINRVCNSIERIYGRK